MSHGVLFQLAGIFVLGIVAQWTSWWVRLPSILLLLTAGILAGPVTGWLHPDELFGGLLLPLVSLSVAVILYEGGLNLKGRRLRSISGVFVLLTTVGAGVSWVVGTLSAHWILGLPWPVATLLGAILVVTGPTVIGPILRRSATAGQSRALLKWEGIIIDPLGATLALLVFTVIQAGPGQGGFAEAALVLGKTLGIGVLSGGLAAGILILVLSRFWAPDTLNNPISLMLMFVAFSAANAVQAESGLLAVTVMGIVLANQKWVSIKHVVEFKENLTVLLISSLFIILSARLRLEDLAGLGWQSLAFVAVLVLIARPASVLIAAWRSSLSWPERVFLCCMAHPRHRRGVDFLGVCPESDERRLPGGGRACAGHVSRGVCDGAGLRRECSAAGPAAGADAVESAGDSVCGGVSLGAGAGPHLEGGRLPGVSDRHRLGEDFPLPDGRAPLPLRQRRLSHATREELDYTELGRMLAVTANNEANSLACLNFVEAFGRQEVYQLPFPPTKAGVQTGVPLEHRGRLLFGPDCTFDRMEELLSGAARIRKTRLTKEFDYAQFQSEHGAAALPLFVVKPDGTVQVCTADGKVDPRPGDLVISVVDEVKKSEGESAAAGGAS